MQRPTFVYIKEHIVKLNSSGKEERKPPVVHLCYCDNLKKADEEGRLKSRYVMTQRSTGFFEIIKKEWDNFDNILFAGDEKLRVCQSCLHRLNWNQFRRFCLPKEEWWKDDNKYRKSNREKIANNFNFESYVKFAKNRMGSKYDFSKKNLPKYHAANALEYKYSLTPKMKYELKKSVWFKCQICNANFDSRFLEIHHIDRNPAHNNIENLQVLCRRCHSRITNG
jgi:5-methylcytosine-specific restriction endonuclease McrA